MKNLLVSPLKTYIFKSIIPLILLLLNFGGAFAQSCIPDSIWFNRQSQIDSFQIMYPGCQVIEGDVLIKGEGIRNLEGLNVITAINGDLHIFDSFLQMPLQDLSGLENLTSVGGTFAIGISNNSDFSLAGLENLVSIDSNLQISSLPNSLDPLSSLEHLGGDFQIYGNGTLEDCGNFHSLDSIGGSLILRYSELKNLNGLEQITYIGGDLDIYVNDSLTSLEGLNSLKYIGGSCYLGYNNSLNNIDDLSSLEHLGHSLTIVYNGSLTDLSAFQNIHQISGDLSLERNHLNDFYGLEYLTKVEGDVSLFTSVSLEGFQSLSFIGGDLSCEGYMSSLNGMNNLDSIGGSLKLNLLWYLNYLNGFENLSFIGGDLELKLLPQLKNLNEFTNLNTVNGNIFITRNDSLEDITGLSNINPSGIKDLIIKQNPQLSECAVESLCDYLQNPNGVVDIHKNGPTCSTPPQIASNCGFTLDCLPYGSYYFDKQALIDSFPTDYSNCTELNGEVQISGNDIITLEPFENITKVNGRLVVSQTELLEDLAGFQNIDSIKGDFILGGYQSINHNLALENVNDLSSLKYVGGNLIIEWNDSLLSLTGLDSLAYIGGSLILTQNDVLESLQGLGAIEFIGNRFALVNNDEITNFEGISDINTLNYFFVATNPRLKDFKGMESLKRVKRSFYINLNASLKDLTGLENLQSAGELIIGDQAFLGNPSLVSLKALAGLDTIKQMLSVSDNAQLSSLEGLDNFVMDSGRIYISVNPHLSWCAIESICNAIENPNIYLGIGSNENGCENVEQVKEACLSVNIPELNTNADVIIYPNPARDHFYIREIENYQIKNVTILNHLGQTVLTRKNTDLRVDLSGLKPAVYIVELNTANGIIRKKLILN